MSTSIEETSGSSATTPSDREVVVALDAQTWSLTRTTADFTPLDFSQRYTGTISDDGRTIIGYWESAPNDSDWQKDFDLVYRRELADTYRPATDGGAGSEGA
jgi:hypothetical protein